MRDEARRQIGLRLRLGAGVFSIPLFRVDQLAGYATLEGEPDEYFLGWLTLHGEKIPVFDLNRVVCDEAAPVQFGTRIIVVAVPKIGRIGLLAAGVTDTVEPGVAEELKLDLYLPMLCTMIPPLPVVA
jgi:chemotaxis signal transduction protein